VLVVAHQDFLDPRAQLAGHPRDLALDVGVVGAFHVAADEPPVEEEGQGDQADGHQEDGQATFELGGHGWSVPSAKFGQSSSVPPDVIGATLRTLCCL